MRQLEIQIAAQQKKEKIVGVDEVGRGPVAGPVVACACYLPLGEYIAGVRDSKQLPPKKRRTVFQDLVSHPALIYRIGVASVEEIDSLNIYRATALAMQRAIEALPWQPDHLLVDGLANKHLPWQHQAIPQGDQHCYLIAAASIIAKELRDEMMLELHQSWPQYHFDRHKGYLTSLHRSTLETFGPSPLHRKSFEPVRSMVS